MCLQWQHKKSSFPSKACFGLESFPDWNGIPAVFFGRFHPAVGLAAWDEAKLKSLQVGNQKKKNPIVILVKATNQNLVQSRTSIRLSVFFKVGAG